MPGAPVNYAASPTHDIPAVKSWGLSLIEWARETRKGVAIPLPSPSDLFASPLPPPPVIDNEKVLENFFGDWFSVPSTLDPAALTIEEDQALWQELVNPSPHIKEQMDKPNGVLPLIHPDSKILKDLQDGLRRACQRRSSPQMEKDMSTAMEQAFSLKQFTAAVKYLSKY
jgi:hypothetical protein